MTCFASIISSNLATFPSSRWVHWICLWKHVLSHWTRSKWRWQPNAQVQPSKVRPVKAMVFPVVMNGCESWTIKKPERWRIDAFELPKCCLTYNVYSSPSLSFMSNFIPEKSLCSTPWGPLKRHIFMGEVTYQTCPFHFFPWSPLITEGCECVNSGWVCRLSHKAKQVWDFCEFFFP